MNNKLAYKLYDILGKELKNGIISQGEKINVSDLNKGLYVIKLDNNKTINFIKK
ncbi:T9SS type A sorting domain-containing protein [Carboxylicivirga mesophila]|uniref:T9SS type A sorting domain-containing protein n=1 Tax=Carboxylicivirga mesophila TaxID=1166478 RepID=A0ABS5KG43_9BACT|nr:T9SS type A sorting domain-containing protein [Carboxylicivirga mesophila]